MFGRYSKVKNSESEVEKVCQKKKKDYCVGLLLLPLYYASNGVTKERKDNSFLTLNS
jgi:hypothetical protein